MQLRKASNRLKRYDDKYMLKSNYANDDVWKVIAELEEVAAGAITVGLESKKINDFNEYMFGWDPH